MPRRRIARSPRRSNGATAWAARRNQGPGADAGNPHHLRLSDLRDHVPDVDELIVERLRAAGAIIIGKTNTPEFGAGSQTFNPVFGKTRNPYDLDRTCGGSSGGAAVALSCGMLPLADGSDLGGSLRNPASFCNVVGFRTSPGRVPHWPSEDLWEGLSVQGPMGRSAADAALMLSALAGPDPRVPISIDEPGERFREPLERDFSGTRVAWSPDLGRYEVEPEVVEVCERSLSALSDIGCTVEPAHPDFRDADEVFQVLRAWMTAAGKEADYHAHRDRMKDTVIWNIEQGLPLTGLDVSRANRQAQRAVPARLRVLRDLRVPRPARGAGASLLRGRALGQGNQRQEDGDLHRLDGAVLRDHGNRAARHFRARRFQPRRPAGRFADRRATSPGFRGAAACPRLRAGDGPRAAASADRLKRRRSLDAGRPRASSAARRRVAEGEMRTSRVRKGEQEPSLRTATNEDHLGVPSKHFPGPERPAARLNETAPASAPGAVPVPPSEYQA